MRKKIDYTNQVFNGLKVIKEYGTKPRPNAAPIIIWQCQCKCGKIVYRRSSHVKRGSAKRCSICYANYNSGIDFSNCEIKFHHWKDITTQAKIRNINFDLSLEYIWNLYLKQNKKCALSGLEIKFASNPEQHRKFRKTTASLDRINNNKGYVEGNVQWVHKIVNTMKMDLNNEKFIKLCRKIGKYCYASKFN